MLKRLTATGFLAFAVTGAVMAAAGPAGADVENNNQGGVLSGNQVVVPVNVEVCGNAINVLNLFPNAIAICDAGGGKGHYKHH